MKLEMQIREFINYNGDSCPYDFNAVVGLLIAAAENLDENALEVELENLGGSFTPEQRKIFIRLARYIETYKNDEE